MEGFLLKEMISVSEKEKKPEFERMPGDTTDASVIWVPGEEFGRNVNGETVEAPQTPEVKDKDLPEPVEVSFEPPKEEKSDK